MMTNVKSTNYENEFEKNLKFSHKNIISSSMVEKNESGCDDSKNDLKFTKNILSGNGTDMNDENKNLNENKNSKKKVEFASEEEKEEAKGKEEEDDISEVKMPEVRTSDKKGGTIKISPEAERFQRKDNNDRFYLKFGLSIAKKNINYSEKFHADIFLSNSGNNEDKYVQIGTTDEYKSKSQIDFPDNYRIEYNFEKHQFIKLVLYNTGFWKTEIIINLSIVITEQAPQFSVPLDFWKSQKLIVTREMLKQDSLSETQNYANIKFERENDFKEQEGAFFLEFNYISMAFVANQLKYKIFKLVDNLITGEKKEILCSNERYGKSPIYFNPGYILTSYLEKNLPLYFVFYDNKGSIGDYLLEKKAFDSLKYTNIKINLYDNKGVNFADMKLSYSLMPNNHFLDYLNHGLDISFIIGVDYTSSNKEPTDPKSLHTLVREGKNVYENAMRSCGGILAYYDKSNQIPLFGFGGVPKGKHMLSHCFNVNGLLNPNIGGGLENVIKIYKESLKSVKLLGPTKFSLLIKNVLDNTIKHRNLMEEDPVMLLKKHNNNDNINNFRTMVEDKIKEVRLNTPKHSKKKSSDLDLPNANHSPPRKTYQPHIDTNPVLDKDQKPSFSTSRRPFIRDPSSKSLGSPRGSVEGPRKSVRKTIRNSIFKDHDDDPLQESNFIIPRAERGYAILLIITDGKIDDMQETKNILVKASNYPISVIIVGVGDNNFGNMNELCKFLINIFSM